MFLTIQQIADTAAQNTNDPEGIDTTQFPGIFNAGYIMFLTKFDKYFAKKRLKKINITKSDELGTRLDNLVQEDGHDFEEIFDPYDVIELNSEGQKVQYVYEVESTWVKDLGFVIERTIEDSGTHEESRIYFPNFPIDPASIFRVRYLPEPKLITTETNMETKVFMPRKFLPQFTQFLAAMQDSVEEEPKRTQQAALLFGQYFVGFGKVYNNKKPLVVGGGSVTPYSNDLI